MKTKIRTLRSTSSGISGTFQNINHHAPKLKLLVDQLAEQIKWLGFEEWVQGNNVHLLKTIDKRVFVIRPYSIKYEGYVGLRLFARVSRHTEIPLVTIFYDNRNFITTFDFCRLLFVMSETQHVCHTDTSPKENTLLTK